MQLLQSIDTGLDGSSGVVGNAPHLIDVAPDGRWWGLLPNGSTIQFAVSTDEGQTWTAASGIVSGSYATFMIDEDGYIHLAYGSGMYYRRGTISGNTITWSAAHTLESSSQYLPLAITAHREDTGWVAHVLMSRYYTTTSTQYCTEYEYNCTYNSTSGSWTCPMCNPGGWGTWYGSHGHDAQAYTCWGSGCCSGVSHTHDVWKSSKTDINADCICTKYSSSHSHGVSSTQTGSTRQVACGTTTNYYSYVYYARVAISSGGSFSTAQGSTSVGGNYSSGGHNYGGQIEFEHGGAGKTPVAKNLWASWVDNDGDRHIRSATYSAGSWTWNTDDEVGLSIAGNRVIDSRWDGTALITAVGNGSDVIVYEGTTQLASVAFGATVHAVAVSYDHERNIYLVAATSGGPPKVNKYTRATTSWSGWTDITATGVAAYSLSTSGHPLGSYVGGVFMASASPYDWYFFTVERLQGPPQQPTVVAPVAADHVIGDAVFEFVHNDAQDDPQVGYALAVRVKGSGTWNWWDGAAFTATETIVASASETVTVPEATLLALGGYDVYEWQIATKDDQNAELGPYASSEFTFRLPYEGWGDVGIG